MFLGTSSFIPTRKPHKKEQEKCPSARTYFMFLDSSIKGSSFEVANLPSSRSPLETVPYLVYEEKLYLLSGIKPNTNPVSLFVDNKIVNEEYFLATFRFDAIFLMISILYMAPDKYISIPQRIYELYRGGLDESQGNNSTLEAGVFALWNNNVDNIKERVMYLCDSVQNDDSRDPPLKPNDGKIRALLTYKAKNFGNYAREHNLMMDAYCSSKQTSESKILRTHHVTYEQRNIQPFAWLFISTLLSDQANKFLSLSNIKISEKEPITAPPPATNHITSGNKTKKKRTLAGVTGTPSIMSFFKAGAPRT